ncbi:MAG: glycosyltransferase [Acidimicrobiales bacterium]
MHKSAILVTGMHRSGTSAATGAIAALGATAGDGLRESGPDNQMGYYELQKVADIHDHLLESVGRSWHDPRPLPTGQLGHLASWRSARRQLVSVLEEEFSDSDLFVVKDPRISRLLPLWAEVLEEFGASPHFVIVTRDPKEVAASLALRNGFSAKKSAALWIDHLVAAEFDTRGRPRTFVAYEELLFDPVEVLGKIGSDLCLEWPLAPGRIRSELEDGLPTSMRHHRGEERISFESMQAMVSLAQECLLLDGAPEAAFDKLRTLWFASTEIDALGVEHASDVNTSLREDLREMRDVVDQRTQWLQGVSEEIRTLQELTAHAVQDCDLQQIRDTVRTLGVNAGNIDLQMNSMQIDLHEQKIRIEEVVATARRVIEEKTGDRIEDLNQKVALLIARDTSADARTRSLEEGFHQLEERIDANLEWAQSNAEALDGQRLSILRHERDIAAMNRRWGSYRAVGQSVFNAAQSRVRSKKSRQGWRPTISATRRPKQRRVTPHVLGRRITSELPPVVAEPHLSILIPMHNAVEMTIRCIESVAKHPPSVDFELLVIDDASTEDLDAIHEIKNLRLVRLVENLGFLRAVNEGARHAEGSFLLLLNSDCVVTECALDELLETFDSFPSAGVVGSKLVHPDGHLLEAGGIIWNDASAWHYGRYLDPGDPSAGYARVVDYVSGAALMLRSSLWASLGGFDESYEPAYYEDADLCFRAAEIGLDVVYQPGSVVLHHEGGSYDEPSRDRHMTRNRQTFEQRWSERLLRHAPNGFDVEREKERSISHRVLVIDARMLYPDRDGGSVRMATLLNAFRLEGAKVTFVPANLFLEEPYTTTLRTSGVEVVGGPDIRSMEQFLAERGDEFDMVIISRLEVAEKTLDTVSTHCKSALVAFDTVDLHWLRESRELKVRGITTSGQSPDATRAAEEAIMEATDLTIVCSDAEADLIELEHPNVRVLVVPTLHDEPVTSSSAADRSDLLFVGSFGHPPNADGVLWFLDEVFPIIVAALPEIRLHLVGADMPATLRRRESEHVIVHGHVGDLTSLLETCRASIAPLRFGAGVKGKITQALLRGVPIVSTSVGAEGAGLADEVNILVADTAETFAKQCVRIVEDEILWDRLREGGLQIARERYGLAAARQYCADLLAITSASK